MVLMLVGHRQVAAVAAAVAVVARSSSVSNHRLEAADPVICTPRSSPAITPISPHSSRLQNVLERFEVRHGRSRRRGSFIASKRRLSSLELCRAQQAVVIETRTVRLCRRSAGRRPFRDGFVGSRAGPHPAASDGRRTVSDLDRCLAL